jgi:cytochrome o ubiquinol oxidase subunit 3
MSRIETQQDDRSIFGFWIYIMTDCVLFASLFATYAVLHTNTNGLPSGQMLFTLPTVLIETIILLTSSLSIGLAMLAVQRNKRELALLWLGVTFVLGLAFLGIELREFGNLIYEGLTWKSSAFLSVFFTLVGTHGLHIMVGLLWMGVMMTKLVTVGLTRANIRRLTMLSLFWHFLDVVWIFIFTIVYLMGGLGV